ncbi:MAG: hypothetical protein R3264_13855, partial [Anaerolineae bacterium]|nr:hypothetical protein [Anaerolineae bacterium]
GERIGLVEAGFKKGVTEMVQESRVSLLGSLISQTALALDNAQRYEVRQHALHREQTLREITDKMRAAISLEQLIKTTAEELSQHFMAEYALVDLGLDASTESLGQADNGQS